MIYNFVTDEFFHAIRGKGAFLNGQELHVSNRPFEDSVITLESKSDNHNGYPYATSLMKVISGGQVAQRILWGYDAALIAQGKAEGAICKEPYEHIWDVAAGSLLIEEAGGIVRNLHSQAYDVRNLNFIASTKAVYERLAASGVV